jgi:hypothetical protein
MSILIPLALIVAFLLVYALWGRDWLKQQPFAEPFFAWIEPFEIFLFKKSPTILFARLKVVTGLMLTYLTSVGDINLASLIPFVPEKYQPWVNGAVNLLPLVISVVGWLDEYMRKKTTLPVEIVAAPEATATAEVKVAIAQVQEAKENAIAVVKAS